MPSVFLFGIIFGLTGNIANLSLYLVSSMSFIIFAGSGQFIALVLIVEEKGLTAIIVTAIVINFRHLLFSANINKIVEVNGFKKLLSAYLLTDEAFIVTTNVDKELKSGKIVHPEVNMEDVLIGAGLTLWFLWNIATIMGYLLGNIIGDAVNISTNFIVSATFLGYLISHWANSPVERKFILAISLISFIFSFWLESADLIILVLSTGFVISMISSKLSSNSEEETS